MCHLMTTVQSIKWNVKPKQENVRQLLARCGHNQDEAESTTLIPKLPKNKLVLNIVLCTWNGLHFFRSLRKIPHFKIFYHLKNVLYSNKMLQFKFWKLILFEFFMGNSNIILTDCKITQRPCVKFSSTNSGLMPCFTKRFCKILTRSQANMGGREKRCQDIRQIPTCKDIPPIFEIAQYFICK